MYLAMQAVLADLTAAQFKTDFDAVVTRYGTGALGMVDTVTVYDRQDAQTFVPAAPETTALPGLGIYVDPTRPILSQAKTVQKRDSELWIVREYFARGQDAAVLVKQVEHAKAAIEAHIDRMWGLAGALRTGGDEQSIVAQYLGIRAIGENYYESSVRVSAPTFQRDDGL